MSRHLIWAASFAFIIAAIAMSTAQYNIEAEKQHAFMMKACVDAGGQWIKNFSTTWNCQRPKEAQ